MFNLKDSNVTGSPAVAMIATFRHNGAATGTGGRADGSIALVGLADSAAQNGGLYWSITINKLTFKDSSRGLHTSN